jgi:ABC-type sugar transport system permease subunit
VLWSIANIVTWAFAGYNMRIIIAQLKAIPGELFERPLWTVRARCGSRGT